MQLQVAINAEMAVKKAITKFKESAQAHEEKQAKLVSYRATLAKALAHYRGPEGTIFGTGTREPASHVFISNKMRWVCRREEKASC
jgi:hypothetical protein